MQALAPRALVRLSGTDNDGAPVCVTLGAFTHYMLSQRDEAAEGGNINMEGGNPNVEGGMDDEPLAVFDSAPANFHRGAHAAL